MIERLLKNNRHALVRTPEQMLKDARLMGRFDETSGTHLEHTPARERFIAASGGAGSATSRNWGIALRAGEQLLGSCACCFADLPAAPWLLAPFFALKRLAAGTERG